MGHARRVLVAAVAGAATLALLPATAGAAPRGASGCPAASSGWSQVTIDFMVEDMIDELVGPVPTADELAAEIAAGTRDTDGSVCYRRNWGEKLHPQAHFFTLTLFQAVDDRAAAVGTSSN